MSFRLFGGYDKNGKKENIDSLDFNPGHIYSIVGTTGSGKTQLLDDIESKACGDGISKRKIKFNSNLKIAQLSQNMNFVLDLTVKEFINYRCKNNLNKNILDYANTLCGEQISPKDTLTRLSGGQSRALMISDIAVNDENSIILIDEIENAGIDKLKAMNLLVNKNKIVLIVTHDPLLALQGEKRIVMINGGISKICTRTMDEIALLNKLYKEHNNNELYRKQLRTGNNII
jgi:ABC-type lipoprotein export system ATPase subunit